MNVDQCVACGAIVPEGRMVCPSCERDSIIMAQVNGAVEEATNDKE